MVFKPRDFSYLIGKTPLSEELLRNHFKLYEGYVNNTKLICEKLEQFLKDGKSSEPEYAELKRRFGWEWNGVRLHELYFENIGGNGDRTLAPKVLDAIKASFGSFDEFLSDLVSTAKMRGIGWVVTYYDPVEQMVVNSWVNEHNESHLAGLKPLIVIDVFEHAFMLDYGLNRPEYVEKIIGNLNWQVIESRV